jgi:hypothetical protein
MQPILYIVLNSLCNAYYFISYGVGNIPKNVPIAMDNPSIPAIIPPALVPLATIAPVVTTAAFVITAPAVVAVAAVAIIPAPVPTAAAVLAVAIPTPAVVVMAAPIVVMP